MTAHSGETILALATGLPAASPARHHAIGLARSLGCDVPEEWFFPVRETAAWHFVACALASNAGGQLCVETNTRNGGLHTDLVVWSESLDGRLCLTTTSGALVLETERGEYVGRYPEEFIVHRRRLEGRLTRVFGQRRSRPERCPRVAAALLLRDLTDPAVGWTAEPADVDAGSAGSSWLAAHPDRADSLIVDLRSGSAMWESTRDPTDVTDAGSTLASPLATPDAAKGLAALMRDAGT